MYVLNLELCDCIIKHYYHVVGPIQAKHDVISLMQVFAIAILYANLKGRNFKNKIRTFCVLKSYVYPFE